MSLDIYILSRNRPEYLKQTIDSFLNQGVQNQLVISDNSTNNDVELLCSNSYPDVKYIRRTPPVGVFEHLNQILDESTSEYIVLFHDDDLACPNYIESMRQVLDDNPNVGAVGCNAAIINSKNKKGMSFLRLKNDIKINSTDLLVKKYTDFFSVGAAPFPAYMYRKSSIKSFKLNTGKYSDVIFLLEILKNKSEIFWLKDILVHYRRHTNNDSNGESIRDRGKLRNVLKNEFGFLKNNSMIIKYRFKYLIYAIRSGRFGLKKRKSFYVFCKYFINFFRFKS